MEYLDKLSATIDRAAIEAVLAERQRWVNQQKKGFLRYRRPFEGLQQYRAQFVDCSGDTISIGSNSEVSGKEQSLIREQLQAFMPWRKGPFSVFGIDIDAEWRSGRKWRRLEPYLPDLKGKIIADIGCNNGYYMFRMAPAQPEFVLGFEPSVQHYYSFKALNSMAGFDNLDINLLGVEHIGLFKESFDVIFLMGIIYHRSSPLDVLNSVQSALKPGGSLIIESQALPGDQPLALFPDKTYAKAPGVYFVPTGSCLQNWLQRAGFDNVELFCSHPMTPDEQRRTDWMIFESYSDFLDPMDRMKTAEGYPAPWRVFLRATKRERKRP
jgi:tRNA (mo5U34)-methyltransferase